MILNEIMKIKWFCLLGYNAVYFGERHVISQKMELFIATALRTSDS
jgi:hypothetical protein